MEEDTDFRRYNQEGALRCIFLCEFHPIAGPKITCQVPENYISKEIFDAVSVYIIPKAQLQRSTLTVTLYESKILGFPVRIDNKKYARNAFYFNLCFVCDAWARSVQYETVVKKLADYLDPEPVQDHQVPVFIEDPSTFHKEQWDLTTYQILPYIDGFNHVARIAAEADVENNLVKACIQNLVYYGVVTLIPIFQYSNVYAVTPKIRSLITDKNLQDRCIQYVAKSIRQPPAFRDIFRMYSNMTYGTTVRDLCIRLNPHPLRINERKLVQFGVLEGLIRRIQKYPVFLPELNHVTARNSSHQSFNGSSSFDEICCTQGISSQQLEDELEKDPNIIVICK
ncbi:GATOR1 complex protein NPRL2 isoform X2 [Anabrus simplex]|uniref:GATOR1 complex protein NPRL2 isoform X2 n=1 Tax=Anabrus simplex TaxID=316456 RepID=UPI0034DD5F6D